MSFASKLESLLVLKAGFCTVLGCGTVRLGLLLRMHTPWSLYGAGRCPELLATALNSLGQQCHFYGVADGYHF